MTSIIAIIHYYYLAVRSIIKCVKKKELNKNIDNLLFPKFRFFFFSIIYQLMKMARINDVKFELWFYFYWHCCNFSLLLEISLFLITHISFIQLKLTLFFLFLKYRFLDMSNCIFEKVWIHANSGVLVRKSRVFLQKGYTVESIHCISTWESKRIWFFFLLEI